MDQYYSYYMAVQIAWIIGAAVWFQRRRDELPLVMSFFLAYVFSFRFWALIHGMTPPVDIGPFGFEPITPGTAAEALGIAALGETALIGTYMLVQKQRLEVKNSVSSPAMLRWLRLHIFVFAAAVIPAVLLARRLTSAQLDQGRVMAFEMSAYLYELPLMLISLAILLTLLWKFQGLRGVMDRVVVLLLIGLVAWLTFGPTGRFLFLGWMLAVTVVATTGMNVRRQVAMLALGFTVALVTFGVAGALRSPSEGADLRQGTWERLIFAEDANMLDGMVLMRQVYPARLPYSYGGEHLEILERPIPRAWWPDKPVGGYMNKLGLTSAATGFTLGISPSLFGSFYQEGGLVGVVVLAAIYGYGLGRLIRYSTRVPAIGGVLIRAICCASLIPLLRGGDLPGIYAWIFMAFWPCFLILFLRRREMLTRPARRPRPRRPASTAPVRAVETGTLRPT